MKFKFWKNRPILTPEEKKKNYNEKLLLLSSGILMGISFPPFSFPFTLLMLFGLVPYLYVIEKEEGLIDINLATYFFAFIFCLITLYWVGSWQASADIFLMISGALLIFVNPIFFLIPSTLYYFARKIIPKKIAIFLLPFFWVTYEFLYMLTDASFPWLTLGNGLPHFLSFIQIADIIGTLGLSLAVVFINIFLYKAVNHFRTSKKFFAINLSFALALILFFIIYGAVKISSYELANKKIKVALIQPNLDPWDKWEGGNLTEITNLYFNLSEEAIKSGAELLVWPETALPIYLMSGTFNEIVDTIYSFINEHNIHLLTGMPDIRYFNKNDPDSIKMPGDVKYNEAGNYYYATYNAIYLFSPDSKNLQRYGKMKLVPFGERLPFADELPFMTDLIKWGVGLSGWNVGEDTLLFSINSSDVMDQKADSLYLSGLVCYESIYPAFVAGFVKKGAEFITIVTNDSWYGNSSGPYQHKEIAVLRAVENRRSVIRAANGGISCIINPLGITQKESEMFTQTYITGDVILQNDYTFFTKNPIIIPTISSVISLWIAGIFILKKFKEKIKND